MGTEDDDDSDLDSLSASKIIVDMENFSTRASELHGHEHIQHAASLGTNNWVQDGKMREGTTHQEETLQEYQQFEIRNRRSRKRWPSHIRGHF
jgi:hypothetical protein